MEKNRGLEKLYLVDDEVFSVETDKLPQASSFPQVFYYCAMKEIVLCLFCRKSVFSYGTVKCSISLV